MVNYTKILWEAYMSGILVLAALIAWNFAEAFDYFFNIQTQTADIQTDRKTDRQAGRQAGRQADRQTDRQTDIKQFIILIHKNPIEENL